ncbi:MAG: glycosyltransferase family 4 protein [Myxococcota bacterium]
MSTTRILFVVNNPDFFLSHRLPIALAARDAGCEVHVATPAVPSSERIRSHGFTFHPFELSRKGASPLAELRSFAQLAWLFRRLRPDLVHLVTIKPVLYGSIAARLLSVPRVVAAVSGLGYIFIAQGARATLRRKLVELGYRFAFAHPKLSVIFQNPDDRDELVGRGLVEAEDSVLIRGSGVNIAQFVPTPEPKGTPTVVLASRLLLDKGVREFVEAARSLRSRGLEARFVLVGAVDAGNPASLSEDDVRSWVAEGTVEWWGHREDMPEVFAQAHIVCLPSYREGLPKVLLEAAACGRAIVTTDVPGCREVVQHEENGLLVPARDSVALADALRTLVADSERRRLFGQRSRRRAETEFSLEHVIRETLRLYGL